MVNLPKKTHLVRGMVFGKNTTPRFWIGREINAFIIQVLSP